jgi:subtilisin family serine protease
MLRLSRYASALSALLVLFLAHPSLAQEAPPPLDDRSMIIQFAPTTTRADADLIALDHSLEVLHRFHLINAVWVRSSDRSAALAVPALQRDPRVHEVTLDQWCTVAMVPNDPMFDEQWALENRGIAASYSDVKPHADIDAKHAWEFSTGSSTIVVAIVDTGIAYTHPDLVNSIYANPNDPPNGVDDDANGKIDDYRGWDFVANDNDASPTPAVSLNYHGTHVGGIVGAVGNNAVGITGVCQNVQLLPLKIGHGQYVSLGAGMSAIDYAADLGAKVINNSWSGSGYSSTFHELIIAVSDAGVIVCNAAGNSLTQPANNNDTNPRYPANYVADLNLGIANSDFRDELEYTSNYGPNTLQIAAPGKVILSTKGPLAEYDPPYGMATGTSMSSPMVAGAVALMESYLTAETPLQIRNRLLDHAERFEALEWGVQEGRRLNVYRAMTDPDPVGPADISDLAVTGQSVESVTLAWTAPGDDGTAGSVQYYDLRYSSEPITEANFEDADFIYECTVPVPAGEQQSAVVFGLSPTSTYYFAIKAADDWRNANAMSNVVMATTLGYPVYGVDPAYLLPPAVVTGTESHAGFEILNTGGSNLVYSITVTEGADRYTIVPTNGAIPAGGSANIAVTVDCSGLCAPGALGNVEIVTNDPLHALNTYIIYQQVIDGPEISGPAAVDFGDVPMFAFTWRDLTIENIGCEALSINSITTNSPDFVVQDRTTQIAEGGRLRVRVYFGPSQPGMYTGTLTIASSDPNHSPLEIPLSGHCLLDKSADNLGARPLNLRNKPNPFKPETEFQFNLPRAGDLEVKIYNAAGGEVRVLRAGRMGSGPNGVRWRGDDAEGRGIASGVYFYRLFLDGAPLGEARRTVLLR